MAGTRPPKPACGVPGAAGRTRRVGLTYPSAHALQTEVTQPPRVPSEARQLPQGAPRTTGRRGGGPLCLRNRGTMAALGSVTGPRVLLV